MGNKTFALIRNYQEIICRVYASNYDEACKKIVKKRSLYNNEELLGKIALIRWIDKMYIKNKDYWRRNMITDNELKECLKSDGAGCRKYILKH